jgi:hypothetical protein
MLWKSQREGKGNRKEVKQMQVPSSPEAAGEAWKDSRLPPLQE